MSDPEKSRQYFHQTTGTTTSSNLLEVEVDSKSRYQLQHTLYPQQHHQQQQQYLRKQLREDWQTRHSTVQYSSPMYIEPSVVLLPPSADIEILRKFNLKEALYPRPITGSNSSQDVSPNHPFHTQHIHPYHQQQHQQQQQRHQHQPQLIQTHQIPSDDMMCIPEQQEYGQLYTSTIPTLHREQNIPLNIGPWSDKEKADFERGFRECGKQWKKIADEYVLTRDRKQVSSHGQKFLMRIASNHGHNQ